MGEEVAAFIRLNDGVQLISHDDILKFCKGKLSHFKIPRYVITVDEFPRTLSGKVQKFKFVKEFEDKIRKAMKVDRIKVAFES
jgi:fatty-acyl-CoA synthase